MRHQHEAGSGVFGLLTGYELLRVLRKMRMLADDGYTAPQGRTVWMETLYDCYTEWIGQLPAVSNQHPAATFGWDSSRVQTTPTLCTGCSFEKE